MQLCACRVRACERSLSQKSLGVFLAFVCFYDFCRFRRAGMSYKVYPYSLSGGISIDWLPGVPLAVWGGPGRTQGAVRAAPKTRNCITSRVNPFSQMGSHRSEPIGKLCRSAFSLILARSFWTGRDVSSAEVHGLHEPLARLPFPFEVPVAQKEEPDDADKAFTTSLIHLLRTSRKSAVTRSMRSEGPCKLAEASGTFG